MFDLQMARSSGTACDQHAHFVRDWSGSPRQRTITCILGIIVRSNEVVRGQWSNSTTLTYELLRPMKAPDRAFQNTHRPFTSTGEGALKVFRRRPIFPA